MPVSFNSLKSGDVLYDCHRHKVGNTTATELGVWRVFVKEVDPTTRKILISWNGNPAKWVEERYLNSLRRYPPEWRRQVACIGEFCSMCNAKRSEGHLSTCTHPKAKKSAPKGK